ncbi:MAG: PIN domain nuclease [Rhodothermales bacterium]
MIVVDSDVWADYFNGSSSAYVERLDSCLVSEEDIAILPIIVTEVLQGFRTTAGFNRARGVLTRLPVIQPDLECHVEAAVLFRTLRRNGITVRGAIDCVIARFCIRSGSTLLSPDADFRLIAQHTDLDLWMPG